MVLVALACFIAHLPHQCAMQRKQDLLRIFLTMIRINSQSVQFQANVQCAEYRNKKIFPCVETLK